MQANQTSPGFSRNERDAVTALAAFLVLMLVVLCTAVLSLYVLSGLPSIMVAGIAFALFVFAVVCGIAFAKAEPSPRRNGPPELVYHYPRRRRRPKAKRASPLP